MDDLKERIKLLEQKFIAFFLAYYI